MKPSPDRAEPKCEFHRPCGGCQLQALSYEKQLEFKENKVRNNLTRIGGFSDVAQVMEPILGMEEPFIIGIKPSSLLGGIRMDRLLQDFMPAAATALFRIAAAIWGIGSMNRYLILSLDLWNEIGFPPMTKVPGGDWCVMY